MRSHEAAHAPQAPGATGDTTAAIFKHPMVPADEPIVIADRDRLHALLDELREGKHDNAVGEATHSGDWTGPSFAYDTEFIGEETYYPRLCVIQVGIPRQISLIDVIALDADDLLPFWELLADPSVEKIVHAGQQDLEPVVRHLDRPPANIFDVQVAAGFIGLAYPASLSKLIAELVSPDAAGCVGAKFSQWDQRPLTPVQVQYAANDVRYLPLLRREMGRRLAENGNAERARREFAELCDPALYRFDAASQRLRVRGAERMGTAQKAALRGLLAWRDETARQRDVPPRTLVADGVVYEIARSLIQCPDELRSVRGLPRPIKRSNADELLTIVREAIQASANEEPDAAIGGKRRIDFDREREEVDALWHQVRERAHAAGVDPAIVASKRELTAYVRSRAAGPGGQDPDVRLLRPGGWRRELLADLLHEAS